MLARTSPSMVVSAVSDVLVIQSHRGPYTVFFATEALPDPNRLLGGDTHFLIDANVARLYASALAPIIRDDRTILIHATEQNKSIEKIIPVYERLVANSVRRDHTLIAIGGGITQDICCFIASTLLRGLAWRYLPTTLLAQADSCIGSKSSINLGSIKNIIGTFRPPADVFVYSGFLGTLEEKETRSGIGEILKVHIIDGVHSFDELAADFQRLTVRRDVLQRYIRSSLAIKKRFIEEDEFDQGLRNVFNYGHSFGHAIESATDYAVPHGIAVSIGMDMANYIAAERGILPRAQYLRMHPPLRANYAEYAATPIPFDGLLAAMMKDKKNSGRNLGLILPVGVEARVQRMAVPPDTAFQAQCAQFLAGMSA